MDHNKNSLSLCLDTDYYYDATRLPRVRKQNDDNDECIYLRACVRVRACVRALYGKEE
jgi:hypothetical protein